MAADVEKRLQKPHGVSPYLHIAVVGLNAYMRRSICAGVNVQSRQVTYKCKLGIKTSPINMPNNFEGTEWYSPGFGVVKTESKYGGTAVTAIK